jgi:hypothetical protein
MSAAKDYGSCAYLHCSAESWRVDCLLYRLTWYVSYPALVARYGVI